MATIADLELLYLSALGHTEGSLADRWAQEYAGKGEFGYWAGESGLAPAQNFSVRDHELAVYRAETGITDLSYTDTKRAFFIGELGL